MRSLLFCVVVALTAGRATAQPLEPLFVHTGSVAAAAPADAAQAPVISRARVGVRLEVLFDAPGGVARQVLLNVGVQSWTARFERLDVDAAGFQSWVGALEQVPESHVVFTARNGVVSGLINAVGTVYQLRTEPSGAYSLERINLHALGDEREPLDAGAQPASSLNQAGTAADDARTFDVLMLYTPAARSAQGGTAQIEALVSQIISDTNTAFARSGVLPRVRLVGSYELGLTESLLMSSDLPSLRASSDARLLRDAFHADLVQLLVSSPDKASCGIGYLLSFDTLDFDAYSVADVACVAQYTPTHELAHNMGSHHAPEDGASGALFPYSYGYKDPEGGFRTVMAYPCAAAVCERVLNFSNPAVEHNGRPTGTAFQNNARSINEAAPIVANFRQATQTIVVSPPNAPTGVSAHVTGNLVTVHWNAVTSIPNEPASYVLQVGTHPGGVNVFSASVGNVTTLSGLVPAGTFFWRVFAVTSAGASPPSSESQFVVGGCAAPPAPVGFAYAIGGRTVTLTWVAGSGSAGGITYLIEAGSAPTLANIVVAPVGGATSLVTTAPPGTYYVRVRAQSACGTSAPSNEQVIVVP